MLTPKQKVFKKIYLRYLDRLSKATNYSSHEERYVETVRAAEDKRLHLLALNSIM
jgi:hypothetical protein